MCYDVSFSTKYELITAYLPDIIIDKNIPIQFELVPHIQAQSFKPYPIVTFTSGNYYLKLFEWGIIADYMNTDEKIYQMRRSMCNIRADKILDKKSYWYRIRKNRCLMPVTGIYEHREIKGWKNKVPYHVKVKNENMFFIPALYRPDSSINKETGEVYSTFGMVTRNANSLMKQIHNAKPDDPRMPLFVPFELAKKWLVPDLTDEEIKSVLDFEMPSENLEYSAVHTIRTSKPRPDDKPKTEPYAWDNLPEIVLS